MLVAVDHICAAYPYSSLEHRRQEHYWWASGSEKRNYEDPVVISVHRYGLFVCGEAYLENIRNVCNLVGAVPLKL